MCPGRAWFDYRPRYPLSLLLVVALVSQYCGDRVPFIASDANR